MLNYYTEDELKNLGLKRYGNNVLISKKSSIYSPERISIGDNVRIDDFTLLSGNITLGNYVHISAFSALYANKGEITIKNYCGVSPRSTLFACTDDFSGQYMISPLVPKEYTNVVSGKIVLNNFTQIGTHSCILPNVIVGEGAVVGACSLVLKSLDDWTINIGSPCKFYKNRSKNLLKYLN